MKNKPTVKVASKKAVKVSPKKVATKKAVKSLEVKNTVKVNKSAQVKAHLLKHKSITTWEAIQLYRATRLSAIIFNLRDNGFIIGNKDIEIDGIRFTKYLYKGETKSEIHKNK